MNEDELRDHPRPPRLESLNLASLKGADDALVCDIDDPDCEVPSGAAPPSPATARNDGIDRDDPEIR